MLKWLNYHWITTMIGVSVAAVLIAAVIVFVVAHTLGGFY